ncbi:MAG: CPBP family intramembrane metalloprotease [Paludibacteraceae bacterium]|nr:CPBP family intramembrane metalloprotease [Paludibacteraceae bacterium]
MTFLRKNTKKLGKLTIWLGILAFFFLLFFVLTLVLTAKGAPMNSPTVIRWILAYQDVCLFILPVLLAVACWNEHPMQWLQLQRAPQLPIALGAALLMIIALPGNNLLAWLNQQITLPESLAYITQWMQAQEDAANAVLEKLMGQTQFGYFLANLLIIAILAAIGEELCFRGMLQGLMDHTQAAIWITAIVFSAIHMQFLGFFPRLLMGALFGYMLLWTGNLWVPIIMHCTNNATITILYYIATVRGTDTKAMDAFGTGDTLWVGIISLVLVGIGIYCLRRSLIMSNASSRTSKGN